MAGPILGGRLYSRASLSVPYWTGAGFVALALALLAGRKGDSSAPGTGNPPLSPADP